MKEHLVFFREFLLEFQTTGAFFPTSRWAALAMTDPLEDGNRPPKKILELGPGTGSVTVSILERMIPGDELTICEINPRFMKALKEKLSKLDSYQKHADQIYFFEGPVEEMPENGTFDVIVCALPFLNFDIETVKSIFEKLRRISSSDTVMTYYEYIGLRKVGKAVSPANRKERIKQVDGYLTNLSKRIRMGKKRVWLNMLPINIYTVKPAA